MIKKIIAMSKRFWFENVIGGKEPIADGSQATTDYLNEKFADSNGKTVQLPEATLPIFEKFQSVNKQLEELNRTRDTLINQFKQYLGENEVGVIDVHSVSWKEVVSSRLDTKRFKAEQPDVYDSYKTESKYRRLKVA